MTASSSPSVVSSAGGSDGGVSLHVDQSAASLWNNLLELPSLKPMSGVVGLDQAGANDPLLSSLNTSKGSSCEDAYDIADDMRELEQRLKSVIDENGI